MKTAYDILKENGIVRRGETDIDVINSPNYYALVNSMQQYANQMIEYRRQHLNQLLETHGLKLVVLQSGEWDLEQTVKTIKI